MTTTPQYPIDPTTALSRDDVMAAAGVKASTVTRWVRIGALHPEPHPFDARRLMFSPEEIAWLLRTLGK